jgi:hypothetical protein
MSHAAKTSEITPLLSIPVRNQRLDLLSLSANDPSGQSPLLIGPSIDEKQLANGSSQGSQKLERR